MTGYTVHTGSNQKFSAGWDNIFGGSKKTAAKPPKKTAEKKSSKSGKSGKKR